MDEIVNLAMAKWPNVPHCYGWLALDARGAWRMRDAQAQAQNRPGDKITNAALLGFINRNYTHDAQGRWYFQNGPQRVFVNLEATPYIARTDPTLGFVLHTGEALTAIDAAWLTDTGQLVLQQAEKVALVDDRDMAQCLAALRMDGEMASEEQLLEWLDSAPVSVHLTLCHAGKCIPLQHIARNALEDYFAYVAQPLDDCQEHRSTPSPASGRGPG